MIFLIGLLCSCVVTGGVFFEIMGILYEKKFPKWIYLVALFLYIILSMLVASIKVPVLNVVFSMLVLCILSYLLYNTAGKNVIINAVIVIVYLAIVDMTVTIIFSIFTSDSAYIALQNPKFFFVSGIGNALLILCTSNLLIQIIIRCQISKVSKCLHLYMIFLVVFEFSILLWALQTNTEIEHNLPLLFLCLGFIIVDGGILYLFKMLSKNTALEKQTELMEQQHDMTVKHYEGLQERYDETQRTLHDIKKHLQVITNIETGKSGLKEEYTEELIQSIDGMLRQFQCSDKIVCAIIWDKIQICNKDGIALDINMQDIEFDFMDKIEVTTLFANLLENAIEACQRSGYPQKEIHLRIHKFKNYIVIKMQNTIGSKLTFDRGKLKSSKPGHHGLGMTILSNLANKYCGNLKYDYTEEYFETKIILSVNCRI